MALCDRCGGEKDRARPCSACGSIDNQLGPQLKRLEDTFSAMTVIKEMWFPHLLTERERRQLARRDGLGGDGI